MKNYESTLPTPNHEHDFEFNEKKTDRAEKAPSVIPSYLPLEEGGASIEETTEDWKYYFERSGKDVYSGLEIVEYIEGLIDSAIGEDGLFVAPYSVLARMVDLGLRPLWSEAEIVTDPALADWAVRDRLYRFTGFKRVKRLVLEFDELGPAAQRQESD